LTKEQKEYHSKQLPKHYYEPHKNDRIEKFENFEEEDA
jgi:hypothetical protein